MHTHLLTNGSSHGDREGPDIPSAQILTFPLIAEQLQLPLLLLIQGVAVSDLDTQSTVGMGHTEGFSAAPAATGIYRPVRTLMGPSLALLERSLSQDW